LAHRTPPRYQADLAIIGITIIWGTTFIVVKSALADASTLLFLALRFALAAVVLGLTFRRAVHKFDKTKPILIGGAVTGLFLFAGYVLQTVGLRYTTPSKSAFLTGLSIVMVPVFAAVFERKPPGLSEALGIAIAAIGMGLMTLRRESLSMDRGDLLTIGCAVAFAVHILLVGHYSPKLGFQALAVVQIATAALLALGTFWWVEPPAIRWTPGLISAIVVTGLFATALAFAVQAWAQQYTTPTRTVLFFALEPVFAWLTSFAVAGELLSRRAALGAVLILAGILMVELKPVSFEANGRGERQNAL
jgi:drug/metabolite transporter (DMT)-like permease